MLTNKPFPRRIYASPREWGRTYYVDLDHQDELERSSSRVFEVDDLVGTWEPLEFLRLADKASDRALYVRKTPHQHDVALFSANGNGFFTRHGPFLQYLNGSQPGGSNRPAHDPGAALALPASPSTEDSLMAQEQKVVDHPHSRDEASLRQRIAEVAYRKAEERGFEPGYELDDWLAAEAEVKAALFSLVDS